MVRVEQQRMRKALIDAEMELQQSAVATQDRRKALQARRTIVCLHNLKVFIYNLGLLLEHHCTPFKACSNGSRISVYCESYCQNAELQSDGMQALEHECEQLRQAATESAAGLAEERRRGVSKERKLMDRSHEAAKLREQLQDAESKHQVQRVASLT